MMAEGDATKLTYTNALSSWNITNLQSTHETFNVSAALMWICEFPHIIHNTV